MGDTKVEIGLGKTEGEVEVVDSEIEGVGDGIIKVGVGDAEIEVRVDTEYEVGMSYAEVDIAVGDTKVEIGVEEVIATSVVKKEVFKVDMVFVVGAAFARAAVVETDPAADVLNMEV